MCAAAWTSRRTNRGSSDCAGVVPAQWASSVADIMCHSLAFQPRERKWNKLHPATPDRTAPLNLVRSEHFACPLPCRPYVAADLAAAPRDFKNTAPAPGKATGRDRV